VPPRFDARVLLVAAAGADSFTHPQLHRRALERLGCHVELVDLDYGHGWGRLLGLPTLAPRLRRAVARQEPELVLVLDDLPLESDTVAALRRASAARWVLWGTGEIPPGRRERLRAVGPLYDALFVASTTARSALAGESSPQVAYLPDGCDPSVCRPMRSRDQFRANVVFAGRATPHRERLLAALAEFGLAVWGPGWRRTQLRDYCRGERLSLTDYVRAYAGATIAVNLHREDAALAGEGCNRRLFEIAAIGVPQVADECADLTLHFTPGREVLVGRDEHELKELVRAALHDQPTAEAIAAAGRRRALSEHTLMHRMAVLLQVVHGARWAEGTPEAAAPPPSPYTLHR
jgi:spore maturation protein CgeB